MTKRLTEQMTPAEFEQALRGGGKRIERARSGVSEQLAKETAKQKREALETVMELILNHTLNKSGNEVVRQYRFPDSNYRYDFAIPRHKLLIEVNGGQWQAKAGHNSGRGVKRDATKANLAAAHGWRLLTFVTDDFKAPLDIANTVLKVINQPN